MRKVLLFLVLLAITFAVVGCFLSPTESQQVVINEPTRKPGSLSASESKALWDRQLVATQIPTPVNPAEGGFWYYEDSERPAGYDPVFASWGGKALLLYQTPDGWVVSKITLDQMYAFGQLNNVGQHSDDMRFAYRPETGEVFVLHDNIFDLATKFYGEYDPDYYVWAWKSLMFIKNGKLHIFFVKPDGSYLVQNFDF